MYLIANKKFSLNPYIISNLKFEEFQYYTFNIIGDKLNKNWIAMYYEDNYLYIKSNFTKEIDENDWMKYV
jgi:hypothetical protein